ncbi:MAG TPA: sugar ABC transporter substrate-binding protein [Devosia sp.]|nr:sugar ABC transporter substrate-binding protein [Devosia sp.]
MKKTLGIALGLAASVVSMTLATAALAQDTTIRMWTFLNPTGTAPREVALAKIISSYEAANPGTKILVEPQVWDQMTPKFLAAHANNNAPDVIWVVTDFLGDAIKSGSLADLNELFVKDWSPERLADNAGAYWNLSEVDGKQHAIFVSRNYISLMYRKDLLDAAGIDPNSFKSWDEFREAAKKLTVTDAAGNVSRYGFATAFSEQQADPSPIIPQILAAGEKLFNDDGTANFASPTGVAAMTFITDLVSKDKVSPADAVSWTVDDLFEQFAADRVAMIQGPAVRVSTLQAKLGKDKVGLAMWPGNGTAEHSPAVMAGWAVGVWSGSPVKEQAGKFVEYMLGPDGDRVWVEDGGQVPGLLSTLENMKDFIAQPGNEFLSVAAEGSAKYGWLTPIEFSVGGYRQVLNKAAQRILVEGVAVEQALKDAADEFNRQNNR